MAREDAAPGHSIGVNTPVGLMPARLALGVQGLALLTAGCRFLTQAGRLDVVAVAGFAGLLGVLLAVPGGVAVAAAIGMRAAPPRWAVAGRVIAALGVVTAAVALAAGTVAADPGVLLVAFLLGAMNVGIFWTLRVRRNRRS